MLVSLTVRDVMCAPVLTVTPEVSVADAAGRLRDAGVGALVVVDDGDPVGILTESDVVAVAAERGDVAALTVGDVMAADPVTIEPSASIEAAAERMRRNDIKKLPVLDGGDLVGIVTTTDLADYLPHVSRGATPGETDRHPDRFTHPDTAYEREDWEFESYGDEDGIHVGDHVTFSKQIGEDDVASFAEASGDTNRLHLDDEYAAGTRFGHRIAHGTLVAGVISAALARLPGLTIYLSQDVTYQGPVDVGERVTARCEVVEALGKRRFRLTTDVETEDGETVVGGEAVVLSDPHP